MLLKILDTDRVDGLCFHFVSFASRSIGINHNISQDGRTAVLTVDREYLGLESKDSIALVMLSISQPSFSRIGKVRSDPLIVDLHIPQAYSMETSLHFHSHTLINPTSNPS